MKKIFLSLMIVSSMLLLTACGNSGNQYDNSVTPKLGDTVIMDGFEVTLVSYTIGKAIDPDDEYQDLIYLDVKIKNTGTASDKLYNNSYKIYSPNNTLINEIYSSDYPTSIDNITEIRPNGEASAQMIFPFLGYGKYYIEFPGVNGTVTAELDIKE